MKHKSSVAGPATVIVAAMLLSASACASRASRGSVAVPPDAFAAAIDSARQYIRSLATSQRFPSVAVTVSEDDSVIWHEAIGMADLSRGIGATPQTMYRIGSVTKLLTAALLMRLVEEGRLDLDTPIGSYITLSAPLRALTLRQLAGHLGGVRHYRGNEFFTNTAYPTLRAGLEIFASDTLVAPPGTRYAYSSYGYNLIGAVIDGVTREPFATSLRELVLEPLQMGNTAPDEKGRAIAERAELYVIPNPGEVTKAPEDDLSSRWPSGGYLSSTDDLARLGRAMLAPGFFQAASIQLMVTPQRLAAGTQTTVGIGWRAGTDSTGRGYYHHGGTSNGGSAFLLVYPERQLVVAVAANAFGQLSEREARAVAAFFLRRQ